MYCQNCGKPLDEGTDICALCGHKLGNFVSNPAGNKWWGVLGFLVPIIGLTLYILWKRTHPTKAKYVGLGALFCVIMNFFWLLLEFVCIIVSHNSI